MFNFKFGARALTPEHVQLQFDVEQPDGSVTAR